MIKRSIKITHLTSAHPYDDVRIFHKQCRTLAREGYQVSLIAQADRDFELDGIRICAVPKTSSRLYRMSYLLWKIYRRALSENADLYHFHDPELIIVGLLLRLKRKQVIYDVHEDVPRDILTKAWLPRSLRACIAKVVEIIEQCASHCFSGIVTVTPTIVKRFAKRPVIEVRNYPVYSEFENITNTYQPFLCYSGLLNEQRGICEMLEVARLSNTKLMMAGNCYANQELTKRLQQDEFAIFHGLLNRQQLGAFYGQALIGLALLKPGPTFNQSLPIKLFEYMAAGLPVIASNFPLWQEIIEQYECGWCLAPDDIDAITERVLFLKNNPNIAKKMGARGRRAVLEHFTWHSQATKLISFYKTITEAKTCAQ